MTRHSISPRKLLPLISFSVLLIATFALQERAMSYLGLNLLFNLTIPIALATIGQLLIIMVNDIDLSVGAFVSLVACIVSTLLVQHPWLGWLALAGLVLAYAALGALIHRFDLPAIVVTLGMSFIWGGLALVIMPAPGGTSPEWLRALMTVKPPLAPMAVVAALLIAAAAHLLIMRSGIGTVLRGLGGNSRSVARAGWRLSGLYALTYGLAGVFGVLAGLTLVGLYTSSGASVASSYTLLSIAGVILGGGEFIGGRVSPIGAVLGALTLSLAGSLLAFMHISPDWQIGAQGAVLILVLAARLLFTRREALL
ncbi:ABC transporter permease [Salinicola endophyticus]|uniref:ABC transporter permease n=1 Tax=Salinicola endophyticus TaxID=1949083 RepID=A0ABY8FGE1_9GAMM|nr:ABC transporter permease [Salinicola endophyticus]WFF41868.1 ABC transporter permease [Salinicola endophyticus]